MNKPNCSLTLRAALITLGGAFLLPVLAPAADAPAKEPAAGQMAALPLKAKFHKAKGTADTEAVGYTLRLHNTSDKSVTVTASIVVSVPVHNSPKIREEAAHTIAPGKGWTIKELAAGDKVTVKADGFAPLELTVP